jgi:hypothetical protein
MKTDLFVRIKKHINLPSIHPGAPLIALLLTAASTINLKAQDTAAPVVTNAVQSQAEKPAPLPLHQIEGNGGIFSTLSAYLVNPPRNGEPVGRPSVGFAFIDLGHGKHIEALTLTETPLSRLELGYGFENFDLGNLPLAVCRATGLNLSETSVELHNFNARVQILKEGEFDQKWIPALTFGVHYKYNDTYNDINSQLKGTLNAIGVSQNDGVDFTLYGSKLFTQLPRPVLVELGGRATEGIWNGLLGFTDSYNFLFEGNVVVFVTDSIALAAEYKQQPRDYTAVPGLIGKAGDWWTIDAAYVVNKHLTLAVGYGHFGTVLNNEANGVFGITTKWEF